MDECDRLAQSWSGSWVGYQSHVYLQGLRPRRAGEHFDSTWGPQMFIGETRGDWAEYPYETILGAVLQRSGTSQEQLDSLSSVADEGATTFEDGKTELLTTLDAVLRSGDDSPLRD